jgi:hypothetical protein
VGDDEAGLVTFWHAIRRTGEGDFELRLSNAERALLRELPAQLRALLEEDSKDPSLRRLFPPAHEGDEEAEAEYRSLMGEELLQGHREALAVLQETADRDRLQEEEVHAWLAALNDLRLVLGTRLDVSEEIYEAEIDADDLGATELGIYLYLTWLQEQFVEAAS